MRPLMSAYAATWHDAAPESAGAAPIGGRDMPRTPGAAFVQDDEASDAALVRSARAGDHGAFARLHDRYAGMVHAMLLARVRAADADDLVQDVFVIVLERLDALRDAETFGAWLGTIARNCAADSHRRRRPAQELPRDLPQRPAPPPEAMEMLETVRSLPPAYRETLLMRFVEGMTGPEIARRTGLMEGSVRVNLCRGMQLLREKLGAGEQP